MLAFADRGVRIQVFRVVNGADGRTTREALGVIRKKDYSLDERLEALSQEEKAQIAEAISYYNKATEHETLAALYTLPATLRRVVDHVLTDGSKFERDLVAVALVEAVRALRKADSDRG